MILDVYPNIIDDKSIINYNTSIYPILVFFYFGNKYESNFNG